MFFPFLSGAFQGVRPGHRDGDRNQSARAHHHDTTCHLSLLFWAAEEDDCFCPVKSNVFIGSAA